MGTNYYLVKNRPTTSRPLHIGKSSAGWRFLFYRPRKYETVGEIAINTFNQWKEYLEYMTGDGAYVVMSEYDEIVPLEKLLDLINEKQKIDNPKQFDYCDDIDGYRFTDSEFS